VKQKRAYFNTLTHTKLISLLLTATFHHPDLPIYPPNIQKYIPSLPPTTAPPPPQSHQIQSHLHPPSSFHNPHPPPTNPPTNPSLPQPPTTTTTDPYTSDDGYDTDPPAHYPKPGHGLARNLRPESEDLQWLVDDNSGVFSHGWRGDGSGVGADGVV